MDCSPPGSSVHEILQQEYWSGLPFPSPGDPHKPWIEPKSPALQADSFLSEPPEKPICYTFTQLYYIRLQSYWESLAGFEEANGCDSKAHLAKKWGQPLTKIQWETEALSLPTYKELSAADNHVRREVGTPSAEPHRNEIAAPDDTLSAVFETQSMLFRNFKLWWWQQIGSK